MNHGNSKVSVVKLQELLPRANGVPFAEAGRLGHGFVEPEKLP